MAKFLGGGRKIFIEIATEYDWISFDIADLQVSKSMQSKAQKHSNFKGSQGLRPWTTLRGLTATTRPQADKLLRFAQSLYPQIQHI